MVSNWPKGIHNYQLMFLFNVVQPSTIINLDEDECDTLSNASSASPSPDLAETDVNTPPAADSHPVIPSTSFTSQGEHVAVYFNEEFYIGDVLEVKDAMTAEVTFIKGFGKKNAFTWPDSIDMATIKAEFLFL